MASGRVGETRFMVFTFIAQSGAGIKDSRTA